MSEESEKSNLWLWLAALLCVPILSAPITAGDYFWHVLTGQVIWSEGLLPGNDIFQAVQDNRPWGTFQWLYEVLLAMAEPRVGLTGIRVAHGLVGAAFLVLWSSALSKRLNWGKEGTLFLMGILFFVYADRVRIRPHVFTFLLTAVWLPYLLNPARIENWGRGAILVGMVGALANLHAGGALILLALIFSSLVGYGLQSDRTWKENRFVSGIFAGSVLLCCMMPGFLEGLAHASRMANANTELFLEWQSPLIYFTQPTQGLPELFHHNIVGALPYLMGLLYALALLKVLLRKGIHGCRALTYLPALCLAGAALILSMRSVRFIPFLTLAIPGTLFLLRSAFRDSSSSVSGRSFRSRAQIVSGVCLLMFSQIYLIRAYGFHEGDLGASVQRWTQEDISPHLYPVDLADFMEEEGVTGGIYNVNTKWGSYLLWRLWPDIRVHYDGRGNLLNLVECNEDDGLPCTEAGRIAFVQNHRGEPAFRDALLRIFLEATDQPGVGYILIPAPTFAQTYPKTTAEEADRPWSPPTEFKRIYPPADDVAPMGSPELWERVRP